MMNNNNCEKCFVTEKDKQINFHDLIANPQLKTVEAIRYIF